MKTLFKLSAIASVAMTLVACGGGGESGGGGSVSAPALVKQEPPANTQTLAPSRVLQLSVGANQAAPAAALPAQTPDSVATPAVPAPAVAPIAALPTPVVVPAGDWTLGTAVDYRAISTGVSNTYGATSDLAASHADGWKGQGQVLLTMTTNISNAAAANFNTAVHLAAPSANSFDYGNLTVANAIASYVAFNTSAAKFSAHNPSFFLNTAANMPGVMVRSEVGAAATYVVGSRNAIIANNLLTVVATPAVGDISFNGVNTGDATKNAALTQQDKVAYISGSAAVIQSKFINLTNVETVRYMDSTTEAGRIFRLGNTLAPRALN